ncbi:MAG: IS30 family transposase [Rudaea sp.]|uniref:IS30 family transposase n=1 Tax=Rudaea sp. TaxID=2136325 RepID=UPI0039E2FBC1
MGHWEGDTMVGKGKARLLTLVERRSRYTVIEPTAEGCARTALAATLRGLYPWQEAVPGGVASITFDNGSEFAEHELIDLVLGCTSYFARPYASWERGTNENTNGLIRQYAPKRTDLGRLNGADVRRIADKLNDRPREVLGFRTPREVFEESLSPCERRRARTRSFRPKRNDPEQTALYTQPECTSELNSRPGESDDVEYKHLILLDE